MRGRKPDYLQSLPRSHKGNMQIPHWKAPEQGNWTRNLFLQGDGANHCAAVLLEKQNSHVVIFPWHAAWYHTCTTRNGLHENNENSWTELNWAPTSARRCSTCFSIWPPEASVGSQAKNQYCRNRSVIHSGLMCWCGLCLCSWPVTTRSCRPCWSQGARTGRGTRPWSSTPSTQLRSRSALTSLQSSSPPFIFSFVFFFFLYCNSFPQFLLCANL